MGISHTRMGPRLLHLEHPGPHSQPRRPNTAAPQVDPGSALTRNGPARPARLLTRNGPARSARPHPYRLPLTSIAHTVLPNPGRVSIIDLESGDAGGCPQGGRHEGSKGSYGWPGVYTGRSHPAYPGCWQRPDLGRAPGFEHRAGHAWRLYIKQLHVLSCLLSAARTSLIKKVSIVSISLILLT